jgi:hypothetical protein
MRVDQVSVSLADRLSTAVISAVASLLTAGVFAAVVTIRGPLDMGFWQAYVLIAGAVVVALGLLGFVVGSERMARYFGVLWGAEQPSKSQAALLLGVVVAICAIIVWRTIGH